METAEQKRTRLYFTTEEVQSILGVTYRTIHRMRRSGVIDDRRDVLKHGNRLFYKKTAIQRISNELVPG